METNKVEIKKTEIKRMEPDLKLINMETVEVEQIEWLFYPFIPFGKVTIIQGDPGEGFCRSKNRQPRKRLEQK
ncbi:hypothetical protein [Bariatricus sp. HCP28S3_D3]|uniref:hypothetical protein n=1 Tax=Bariatricus sp. HCP28S3_D3 TaxID=3438901 RepID=UPI003F8C8103